MPLMKLRILTQFLTLKHQAKFVADDIQNFFFIFQRKQVLTFHVNHMKCQDLFSLKKKKKKMSSAAVSGLF